MAGSVAILTGASRGIGACIAQIWLDLDPDNKLVAVSRNGASMAPLAKEYGESRVSLVVGDVTNKDTGERAISEAMSKFGRLDSIIANAGVLDPVSPVEHVDLDEWRHLFEVNFFSVVELIQLAIPELKKTRGNVVVVSSGASVKAYSSWAAYGSSKAALNHFILSLASEVSEINAISVAPGVVDTQMQKDIREKFGKDMSKDGLQRFIDLHENNQLLPPSVPARVLANIAYHGCPKELSGRYLRYDDVSLEKFSK